jgi:hypothetical protein
VELVDDTRFIIQINPCFKREKKCIEECILICIILLLLDMLTQYINKAMSKAVYDKLEDGSFSSKIHNVQILLIKNIKVKKE